MANTETPQHEADDTPPALLRTKTRRGRTPLHMLGRLDANGPPTQLLGDARAMIAEMYALLRLAEEEIRATALEEDRSDEVAREIRAFLQGEEEVSGL